MLCHVSVLIGAFCLRHRARDKSFLFRLRFRIFYYYFGFATLRNVSKLTFFDKIGRAKSVGFWFYSAIWRSESRISSRYLEITSISWIYSLTFSRKKRIIILASPGFKATHLCDPSYQKETLSWGIVRAMKNSCEMIHKFRDKIGCATSWRFGFFRLFHEMRLDFFVISWDHFEFSL